MMESVAKDTTSFSIPCFWTNSYSIALVIPVMVLAITGLNKLPIL